MFHPIRCKLLFALSVLFSLQANAQSWLALQPTGTLPFARSQATAVWDPGTNRLILFGGTSNGCATSSALNDVWLLTKANGQGGTGAWSQPGTSGTAPSARQSHTAVYNPTTNRMIVYGGDNCGTPGDPAVYVLTNANGNAVTPTWIAPLAVSGTPDVIPSHHTATYDTTNNVMTVVLSGAAPAEAWALTHADGNGGTPTWSELATSSLFTATDHTAVYDPSSNEVIVMDAATANVFLLSHANGIGGASAWTTLSVTGTKPEARVGANAAYDTLTNRLIIFGGKTSTGQVNEVWVLRHANGTGGTSAWEQLSPTGLPGPGSRGGTNERASVTYDTTNQLLTMFGGGTDFGSSAAFNNDSWSLTLPPFCGYAINPETQWFSSVGGANSIAMTADTGCGWVASGGPTWIHLTSGTSGTGNGTINYTVDANPNAGGRAGTITVAGRTFVISQQGTAPCSTNSISPTSASFTTTGGIGTVLVTSFCQWTAVSNDAGVVIDSQTDAGNGTVQYTVTPGFQFSKTATMTIAGQTFTVHLNGPCSISLTTSSQEIPKSGGTGSVSFTETGACTWTAVSSAPWITLTSSTTGSGSGSVNFSVAANPGITPRAGTVTVGSQTFTIFELGVQLDFVSVTPCRVVDTRAGQGKSGAFGPPSLAGFSSRDFPVLSSSCGISGSALAYSLNMTVVPPGPVSFLSTWPAGQPFPTVSTLNSTDGSVIANAALVPSGTSGAITAVAGNPTNLIIDINGYFALPGGAGLNFYPVTPCRVADTRASQGKTGAFGPPAMAANASRNFPILSSGCGIPGSAQAYSLNMTVVPSGPLSFLSAWPAGQPFPNVSTLNAPTGSTLANAAIVTAGASGAITALAGNPTDLIIDINGYFAPPGAGGLHFYPVTPCRVADTRASQGKTGAFGPPSMAGFSSRIFPILSGSCAIPSSAQAYSLNMTAVPSGSLSFLSTWPTGQPYPNVSTLNSTNGNVIANAAIVPAGTSGSITVVTGNLTDLIIDIDGYFAP
jgi:hypothetical protein